MNRFAIALSSVAVCLLPSAGHAQIRGTDSSGLPLRQALITLTAGHTYDLRTDWTLTPVGASTPDSVLSLRRLGATTAVAGKDGCGSDITASCFTYTVPAGAGGSYVMMLRAYRV